MKSILNSLAVGLGRKLAFELINDVRKEHDVKLSPRSAKAFNVRRLTIIDSNGYKIDVELFSDNAKALTVIADWNQDQSITL